MNDSKTETLEQLQNYIQGYKGILTPVIIDYLNGLINLEFSALNEKILSQIEMAKLSELLIYRKIVIYNIYNKVLNVLEKYGNNLNSQITPQGLSIYGIDRYKNKYNIFDFYPNENGISNINLKQTIIDSAKRKEQIDRLYKELEVIKKSKETGGIIRRGVVIPNKVTKFTYINNLINELESRFSLDGNIEYVTDTQDLFIRDILGSEGLEVTQDFTKNPAFYNPNITLQSLSLHDWPMAVERQMTKKLVKNYPHIRIAKTLKYY